MAASRETLHPLIRRSLQRVEEMNRDARFEPDSYVAHDLNIMIGCWVAIQQALWSRDTFNEFEAKMERHFNAMVCNGYAPSGF